MEEYKVGIIKTMQLILEEIDKDKISEETIRKIYRLFDRIEGLFVRMSVGHNNG